MRVRPEPVLGTKKGPNWLLYKPQHRPEIGLLNDNFGHSGMSLLGWGHATFAWCAGHKQRQNIAC